MIVVGIIIKNKKVLLGKLKPEKLNDFGGIPYIFPGGTVLEGEKNETGVIREVKEETGLDVKVMKEITSRIHPQTKKEIHYFHCELIDGDLDTSNDLNDDIESLEWIEFSKIKEYVPFLFVDLERFFESLN